MLENPFITDGQNVEIVEVKEKKIRSRDWCNMHNSRVPKQPIHSIESWCKENGIDYREGEKYLLHFQIPPNIEHIPKLPKGYAFKGGVARYALHTALKTGRGNTPRDYDVVRIESIQSDGKSDSAVSWKFMGKDAKHGDFVEILPNLINHFERCDVTINEVLCTNDEVIATHRAILDTLGQQLQTSHYEYKRYYGAGRKIRAKMLRFLAENPQQILSTRDWAHKENISDFWLAVNLDRAIQRSVATAERYVSLLHELELLPEKCKSTEDAVEYFMETVEGFRFNTNTNLDTVMNVREDILYDIQDALSRKK
jgi:hypothetical protein